MARIAGVDIPDNKRGVISLTYIYGVGRNTAASILEAAEVDVNKKVADQTNDERKKVREFIADNLTVEGELRSETNMNIKRLQDIGSYRGIRHRIGLPLRGQRTKNNARTRKGKKKTVANKKNPKNKQRQG